MTSMINTNHPAIARMPRPSHIASALIGAVAGFTLAAVLAMPIGGGDPAPTAPSNAGTGTSSSVLPDPQLDAMLRSQLAAGSGRGSGSVLADLRIDELLRATFGSTPTSTGGASAADHALFEGAGVFEETRVGALATDDPYAIGFDPYGGFVEPSVTAPVVGSGSSSVLPDPKVDELPRATVASKPAPAGGASATDHALFEGAGVFEETRAGALAAEDPYAIGFDPYGGFVEPSAPVR